MTDKPQTTRRCPACNGIGYNPGDHDCAECNGLGKLSQKEYESLIPSAKSQTTEFRSFYDLLKAQEKGTPITPFEEAAWKLAIQIGGGQNVHNVYPALTGFAKEILNA